MKFSVIIPLYNKAPHVAAAVNSALGQSHSPLEIIVVDDGSSDGGEEVVRGLADPRVRLLFRSPPGPGGYAARNHGIEAAQGDWIAFLDADDMWRADHLERLASAAHAAGGTIGCAFSAFDLVYPDRRIGYKHSTKFLVPGEALSFAQVLRAWVDAGRCPIWTGACAFSTELLRRVGMFPAGRARRGGDKDLWLRALSQTRAAYSPESTAEFHQEAVNRVSKNTRHDELPLVVRTIAALIPTLSDPTEIALLKEISNLEVMLYAKRASGAGLPVPPSSFSKLYFPSGIKRSLQMAAYVAGGRLLSAIRQGPAVAATE